MPLIERSLVAAGPHFDRWSSPLRIAVLLALLLAALPRVLAAQPVMSPHRSLPGDEVRGTAAERQDWPEIAVGVVEVGPGDLEAGYLTVWQDTRTALSGFTNLFGTLNGNETDIYASRLAADGTPLDGDPLLLATEGRDQTRPRVAWGGESWLVVWTSERESWYFFEDLMAVRVAPDGSPLDAEPIALRPENNDPANDRASEPRLTGNGDGWLVVWQDVVWNGTFFLPAIGGMRLAADGTPLDPEPVMLHVHGSAAFGPREPQVAWAGGQYLVVWEEVANQGLRGKRFDAGLQPIDASPFVIDPSAGRPRLATDGTDFLVASSSRRVFRVTAAGEVLDAGGISLGSEHRWQGQSTEVIWDGLDWVAAFSSSDGAFFEPDVYTARIASDGTVLPPGPQRAYDSAADEEKVVLAPVAGGGAQLVWTVRDIAGGSQEATYAGRVAADGSSLPRQEVGSGLSRQAWASAVTRGDEHLVVYLSQGGGSSRVVAQRLSAAGVALDAQPIVVAMYPESTKVFPDVAFDGTRYLVAWTLGGELIGRRLGLDAQPIDPAPVPLLADAAGAMGVGGLNGRFLIAYTHAFSGDQRSLRGVTVDGGDLAVGSPVVLGGNFARAPRVEALGGRWLVVWERQASHNNSASSILATFVDSAGVASGVLTVDGAGFGDAPSVAPAGDRALVVWHDNASFNQAAIEGRFIAPDATFLTDEFLIADAANDQFFPSAAYDGTRFVVAWNDYRHIVSPEPLRGEVYAARVHPDGPVIDPGGFALTSSPDPEDLPVVAGADGSAVVLYSRLAGPNGPQVQRMTLRVVTAAESGVLFADGFESGDLTAWSAHSGG